MAPLTYDFDELCPCGHPMGIHDVDEYRGDGTEMCCVTGCNQVGCPGRRRPLPPYDEEAT